MDTQSNESFNNMVSWLAPKNKFYCGSMSLANQLGIAVGINSIGLVSASKDNSKSLTVVISTELCTHCCDCCVWICFHDHYLCFFAWLKKFQQRNDSHFGACRTSLYFTSTGGYRGFWCKIWQKGTTFKVLMENVNETKCSSTVCMYSSIVQKNPQYLIFLEYAVHTTQGSKYGKWSYSSVGSPCQSCRIPAYRSTRISRF